MWGQDSEFVEDLVTRVLEGFGGELCVCLSLLLLFWLNPAACGTLVP